MSMGKAFDERERAEEAYFAHTQDVLAIANLRKQLAMTHLGNKFGAELTNELHTKYGPSLLDAVMAQRLEHLTGGKPELSDLDAEKLGLSVEDARRATAEQEQRSRTSVAGDTISENIALRLAGHDVGGEGYGAHVRRAVSTKGTGFGGKAAG